MNEQRNICVQLSARRLLPAVERKTDTKKGGGPVAISSKILSCASAAVRGTALCARFIAALASLSAFSLSYIPTCTGNRELLRKSPHF